MGLALVGPPGAGKGTQAQKIAFEYGFCHVSTGEMLRQRASQADDLGRQLQGFINAGDLVPDRVAAQVVEERLSRSDCVGGFVLDGFPRSRSQAEELNQVLRRQQNQLSRVLLLNVSERELLARLRLRWHCDHCGRTSTKEGLCDACGAMLARRYDDSEVTVRRRLELYRKETVPMIDYYRAKGLLVEVDGSGDPDEVFWRIKERLRSLNGRK